MSIRESHALICSPPSSSNKLIFARTGKSKHSEGGVRILRWTPSCLFGGSSHGLPDADGIYNPIFTAGKGHKPIRACSHSSEHADGDLYSKQNPWPLQGLHRQLLHSLGSFGIGAGGLVEGTIGLLLIAGSLGMGARIIWQKGSQLASQPRKYEAVVEFPLASGITIGTLVRVRGVDVGSVIHVRPCLDRIDAYIQVMDSSAYIPRNALVEVNQSGLLGETLIDITPMNPIPRPSAGPLDPDCSAEGLIVCDKGKIRGNQGVSMDDLMRLCGKMARKTKGSDVNELFKTADQIGNVLDTSKPLLEKIEMFVEDVEPVIKEVQDGKLLKDLTELLKLATYTAHNLRMSSLTTENSRLLSDSVANLARTLKSLESTSKDMGNILGNDKNRNDMKHLIELLSRLVGP